MWVVQDVFATLSLRSLTGLLFQVSDVFSIALGSRCSSCPHGGLTTLLLPLITGVRRQRGKTAPSTASTHPAVFVIHHDAAGASSRHSVRSEVVAHNEDPILLHHRLPRTCPQMPDVTLFLYQTSHARILLHFGSSSRPLTRSPRQFDV